MLVFINVRWAQLILGWVTVYERVNHLGLQPTTQPSTLFGTVKWVSVFELINNNNKWRWWAAYRWTHSPSWLVWSEGWQPLSTQLAFVETNGLNSRNGLAIMTALQTLALVLLFLLLIITRGLPKNMLSLSTNNDCCYFWHPTSLAPVTRDTVWSRSSVLIMCSLISGWMMLFRAAMVVNGCIND